MAAAAWALAHEGHEPIPVKGLTVKGNTLIVSPGARKALDLRTADVVTRDIERTILAQATVVLQPRAHAFATTLLPGRIERILVNPGQAVRAGEPLALVRSLELERLEAETETAEWELQLAEQTLERAEALAKQGTLPQRDLLTAKNRKQELANTVLIYQLKRKTLGLGPRSAATIGLLPISSPIAGKVAHIDITPGAVVDQQMHPLDIVDAAKLWVRADVPEAYVAQVAIGNPAYVELIALASNSSPKTHRFSGIIRARNNRVDPKTLTETVWIELGAVSVASGESSSTTDHSPVTTHHSPFVPGMTGLAHIVVEWQPKAVLVPEAAVIQEGMESYVFVQTEPGKYERTPFAAGLRSQGHVQAVSGVFAIDTVVTRGQRQLAASFVQGVLRPSPAARRSSGLRVEAVRTWPIAAIVTLDATVELPPSSKVLVAPPLSGTMAEIAVTQPQQIQAGQRLARILSPEVQNLQLELIRADLNANLLQETLESYRKADPENSGVIPRQTLAEAESKLKIANGKKENLRRQLQTVGLTAEEIDAVVQKHEATGHVWLRSPRKGHVIPAAMALGQFVKAGETLFEVQERSQTWVRGRVYEQDLSRVQVGQTARLRLTSDPSYVAEAKVTRIESLPGLDGHSRAAWVEIDNANGLLRENMLGRLTVEVGTPQTALAAPVSAVAREGSQTSLFVYDREKEVFNRRPVQLGRHDDRFVEILKGVKAKDHIAVTAVAELRRSLGRIK